MLATFESGVKITNITLYFAFKCFKVGLALQAAILILEPNNYFSKYLVLNQHFIILRQIVVVTKEWFYENGAKKI